MATTIPSSDLTTSTALDLPQSVPPAAAPAREHRYAEAVVIYIGIALAGLFWGAFTIGAGFGIVRTVLTPAPHPGVPNAAIAAPWIGFTLFAILVFAVFSAVLAYGTILGLRSRARAAG